MQKVITEKQDLRYLKWAHGRNSSGTAGTFLKSQEIINGEKIIIRYKNRYSLALNCAIYLYINKWRN